MGWAQTVAIRALQVIVSQATSKGQGIFVYAGIPAAGNPPQESMSNATVDPFGQAVQQGVVSYGAGGSFAQLLGNSLLLNFGSGGSAVLFATAGGRLAIFSGNISGDIQSEIELRSASASGITGGEVVVSAGAVVLNNSASTTIPAGSVSGFPIPGNATLAQVITAVNNLYTMLGNVGIHL